MNTMFDGDIVFALSKGEAEADIDALGVMAAEAVMQAIVRAVRMAPTLGGSISHFGMRNLDNRFDSRINPLRSNGQKLKKERPPEGFDSMVAIDPDVSWFNLYNKQLMQPAQIAFHELAEAHARLVLDLDYLPQGEQLGAHDVALDREVRFKRERPGQFVVLPIGTNLRLATRNDWLQLFASLDLKQTRNRKHSELRMQSFIDSFLHRQ